MSVLRRVVVAFCVVACGLSACSVERDNTPPVHERAQVAKDRDERAVLAALRELDPCALLDPAAAGWTGVAPVYTGPHNCEVRQGQTEPVAGVSIGSRFDGDIKLADFTQRPIDGVKAYVSQQRQDKDSCAVHVPVSFTYSIRFGASNTPESPGAIDPCGVATAFATDAVAKLAEPDALTADLPLVDWDVCALLTGAMPAGVEDPDNYTATVPIDGEGIDGCLANEPGTYGQGLELTMAYTVHPSWSGDEKTVGGKQVWEYDGTDCSVSWTNGTVNAGDPLKTDQVLELSTPDCAETEAVAAEVIKTLGGQPQKGAEPQRPLLYRAEEPDLPVAGACSYITDDPATCEPYAKVDVPQGQEAIVAAAEVDPNVSCAVAVDAVREHYGRALTPVTDPSQEPSGCDFVQPDRAVRITLEVRPDGVRAPASGADRIEVAGRDGWVLDDGAQSHQGQLALGDGARIDFWLGGDGDANKLEPMLADVIEKHFS